MLDEIEAELRSSSNTEDELAEPGDILFYDSRIQISGSKILLSSNSFLAIHSTVDTDKAQRIRKNAVDSKIPKSVIINYFETATRSYLNQHSQCSY